jgi:hypothetical protein
MDIKIYKLDKIVSVGALRITFRLYRSRLCGIRGFGGLDKGFAQQRPGLVKCGGGLEAACAAIKSGKERSD